jgi:hypothetical protein
VNSKSGGTKCCCLFASKALNIFPEGTVKTGNALGQASFESQNQTRTSQRWEK